MSIFIRFSLALLFSIALTVPLFGQTFSVDPDSTEGWGWKDSLSIFESAMVNQLESTNYIDWRIEKDLPDSTWQVEICQATYLCWPYWVDAETMILDSLQQDILQVKMYPHSEGVGSVTIWLTSQTDAEYTWEETYTLDSRTNSVRIETGEARQKMVRWLNDVRNGGAALDVNFPSSANLNLQAYDLLGRNIGSVWQGRVSAGASVVPFSGVSMWQSLPAGVYILRLDAGQYGFYTERFAVVR